MTGSALGVQMLQLRGRTGVRPTKKRSFEAAKLLYNTRRVFDKYVKSKGMLLLHIYYT